MAFLWKLSRLRSTVVTSFCVQCKNWECWLLRYACPGEGECAFGSRAGEKGEYRCWKTEVNNGVLPVHKTNARSQFVGTSKVCD